RFSNGGVGAHQHHYGRGVTVAFAGNYPQLNRSPALFIELIILSDTVTALRKRLSPEESREAALDAARALLVEHGPQAVTLKAVAARIGRTHA
ncbi:TetR family transcriptional regulator, partial [Klebsiella pneumoniae]|uniref:TetR family transcriptional regulator n=1 Tax=Klebsiella pneumoniae TaxID=573 RepID=UPI0038548494